MCQLAISLLFSIYNSPSPLSRTILTILKTKTEANRTCGELHGETCFAFEFVGNSRKTRKRKKGGASAGGVQGRTAALSGSGRQSTAQFGEYRSGAGSRALPTETFRYEVGTGAELGNQLPFAAS
jgi:hypothetical protein